MGTSVREKNQIKIIMHRIVKGEIAIHIDTADLQSGQRGRFIQHITVINSIKTVFIHGQSVIGTYDQPGLKILPLWTVSTFRNRLYPSVITKLVPRIHCLVVTHLGETSIIQIQDGPERMITTCHRSHTGQDTDSEVIG